MKGRIVKIEKYINEVVYVETGIKQPEQYKYEKFHGGNGSYVVGGEYLGVSLDITIFVYDLGKDITIDIYSDVLKALNMKRLSNKILDKISASVGKKINLYEDTNNISFDINQIL